jgi:hypothetical protein
LILIVAKLQFCFKPTLKIWGAVFCKMRGNQT